MEPSEAGVVCVGSVNVDLVAYTDSLPQVGETVIGRSFEKNAGGKGANQIVQASLLGAPAWLIGSVGNDAHGYESITTLKDAGVDVSGVSRTGDCCTGIAQICVDDAGANTIVVVPGANLAIEPKDVEGQGALFQKGRVLLCQLEIPLETVLCALTLAKKEGMKTILNPAPAVPLSDDMYALCTYLIPNETELAVLCPGTDTESLPSMTAAAQSLVDKGVGNVIVTLGERGALLVTEEGKQHHFELERQVQAEDTVGAGDAFAGALAAFLASGAEVAIAIPKACAIASLSVLKKGAQSSYARLAELPEHLKLPVQA